MDLKSNVILVIYCNLILPNIISEGLYVSLNGAKNHTRFPVYKKNNSLHSPQSKLNLASQKLFEANSRILQIDPDFDNYILGPLALPSNEVEQGLSKIKKFYPQKPKPEVEPKSEDEESEEDESPEHESNYKDSRESDEDHDEKYSKDSQEDEKDSEEDEKYEKKPDKDSEEEEHSYEHAHESEEHKKEDDHHHYEDHSGEYHKHHSGEHHAHHSHEDHSGEHHAHHSHEDHSGENNYVVHEHGDHPEHDEHHLESEQTHENPDGAPPLPPPPPPPAKGSVDYVLIPMILIGLFAPIFCVVFVILGSISAIFCSKQPNGSCQGMRSLSSSFMDFSFYRNSIQPTIESLMTTVSRAVDLDWDEN